MKCGDNERPHTTCALGRNRENGKIRKQLGYLKLINRHFYISETKRHLF